MAASRSKRSNAGNRMTKLIEEQAEEESEDNIYNTLYGGFIEEENDQDYEEEDQEEDIVDSGWSNYKGSNLSLPNISLQKSHWFLAEISLVSDRM